MANPQPTPFLRFSMELFEAIVKTDFSPGERKILDGIIRETYGYGRKYAQVSYFKFKQLTGISRTAWLRGKQSLETRNIIKTYRSREWSLVKSMDKSLVRGPDKALIYGIQKDYELWSKVAQADHFKNMKGRASGPPIIDSIDNIIDNDKPSDLQSPESTPKEQNQEPPAPPGSIPQMATAEFFKEADPIVVSILGKLKTNRDRKFPYNWIGMKIKKKWDPEIILQVLDDINHAPLSAVREPWKYFETVWSTNAQNYMAAQNRKIHERYQGKNG